VEGGEIVRKRCWHGNTSVGWFQARNTTKSRWNTNTATSVTSEGQRSKSGGNCGGGARGRATGDVLRVVWVTGITVMRVVAKGQDSKFLDSNGKLRFRNNEGRSRFGRTCWLALAKSKAPACLSLSTDGESKGSGTCPTNSPLVPKVHL